MGEEGSFLKRRRGDVAIVEGLDDSRARLSWRERSTVFTT